MRIITQLKEYWLFGGRQSVGSTAHLADPVVLREPVVVEDGEHEGLVEGVGVRQVLELEGLVEEGVERLPVDFRLELLESLCLGDEEDLQVPD